MQYILVALAAYVLGSSSMAFYLSKLKNVDIRKSGTGNLGASNTTVLLGWWSGILVLIHDVGKGILAVGSARSCFPSCLISAMLPAWPVRWGIFSPSIWVSGAARVLLPTLA